MDNETRIAYELGFYKSQAQILQDNLKMLMKHVPFDYPEMEILTEMDLEGECDEVVKRAAWLSDTKERKL